jgi:hypothetical protein
MKMTIKNYDASYENDVLLLMKAFHDEHLHNILPEFVIEDARAYCRTVYDREGTVAKLLLDDNKVVGASVGAVVPTIYNFKHREFAEIVWYIKPEYRGRYGLLLFKAMMEDVERLGVGTVRMAYVHNDCADTVDKFYARNGFVKMETHVLKRMG